VNINLIGTFEEVVNDYVVKTRLGSLIELFNNYTCNKDIQIFNFDRGSNITFELNNPPYRKNFEIVFENMHKYWSGPIVVGPKAASI